MFDKEAAGLDLLRNTDAIRIPKVVLSNNFEDTSSATLVDISGSNNHGNYMNFDAFDFTERIYTCHETSSAAIIENVEANIAIYPNPTHDKLTLEIEGFTPTHLSILDITGKTVINCNENMNTIDVSGLVNGVYFLQIQTADKIISKKFIKH